MDEPESTYLPGQTQANVRDMFVRSMPVRRPEPEDETRVMDGRPLLQLAAVVLPILGLLAVLAAFLASCATGPTLPPMPPLPGPNVNDWAAHPCTFIGAAWDVDAGAYRETTGPCPDGGQ